MDATLCGFRPGKPLFGALRVPPSKSIAQRALIASALCRGMTWIRGLSARDAGRDVRDALALVRGVAAKTREIALEHGRGDVLVHGTAPGPQRGWRAEAPLDAGESGTLARLATAAAGLCGDVRHAIEVGARGSLFGRSSPALFRSLERAGVRCEFTARPGAWPVRLQPAAAPLELLLEQPGSSQEVSALLLAAAAWPGARVLRVAGPIPSRPYVELTLRMLAERAVEVHAARRGEGEEFRIRGPLESGEGACALEPDASSAAVLLGAACLTGGEVSIAGLGPQSAQGDVHIAEHLAAFGCRAGFDARGIFAGGGPLRGAELDLAGEPDLAPVLAAVAAAAALRHGARSRLGGLATLQGKESPRLTVLAGALAALGLSARAADGALEIAPGGPAASAAGPELALDPRGDHRMAFAFALLGLLREGVLVRDPGCVAKSWPGFWRELEAAGLSLAAGETPRT